MKIGIFPSMVVVCAVVALSIFASRWFPVLGFLLVPVFGYLMGDWLVGLDNRFGGGAAPNRARLLIHILVALVWGLWLVGVTVALVLGIATGRWEELLRAATGPHVP